MGEIRFVWGFWFKTMIWKTTAPSTALKCCRWMRWIWPTWFHDPAKVLRMGWFYLSERPKVNVQNNLLNNKKAQTGDDKIIDKWESTQGGNKQRCFWKFGFFFQQTVFFWWQPANPRNVWKMIFLEFVFGSLKYRYTYSKIILYIYMWHVCKKTLWWQINMAMAKSLRLCSTSESGTTTVDGRNPKQPPGMYKNPVNNGINYQPQTGELAGFLKHQQ